MPKQAEPTGCSDEQLLITQTGDAAMHSMPGIFARDFPEHSVFPCFSWKHLQTFSAIINQQGKRRQIFKHPFSWLTAFGTQVMLIMQNELVAIDESNQIEMLIIAANQLST